MAKLAGRIRLAVALMLGAAGCGSTPTMPSTPSAVQEGTFSQPPAAPGLCVMGFDDLRVHGAPFTGQTACGLAVTVTLGSWQASTTYGHPPPFVQFLSPAGTTMIGEITLKDAGGRFGFGSVDIYSSTTKIPYEISGFDRGARAFTIQDLQSNTFGNFATIVNRSAAVPIDTLRIRLTNPAAPCCSNPVGLDNIRVFR